MAKKEVVLIGAGKIGRGYIADLFNTAGYKLVFLEYAEGLVQKLRQQGYYTIFRSHDDRPGFDKAVIRGYDAYCTQTEYEQCINAIASTNYVTIHVFPMACESIGHMIGDAIKLRYKNGNSEPLDLLFCVNFVYPGEIFKKYILERLTPEEAAFMEEHVGFVESLVFRLGADPMPEMRQEDELSILSGDRDFLPVGNEWKGQIPEGVKLVVRDNMPARLVYKIWAGNTSHLAKASFGQRRGYQWAWQSDEDPYVRKCAAFCAREASFGVAAEFGMQESELRDHPEERFDPASINKDVEDPLTRIAQDPKRKLARNDRLVGPALLCLKHGRLPYYLARSAAMMFYFQNPKDAAAVEIQNYVSENGIEKAIEKYCQLDRSKKEEELLFQLILAQYFEENDADPFDMPYYKKA